MVFTCTASREHPECDRGRPPPTTGLWSMHGSPGSHVLGDHLDGAAGTLRSAHPAALAVVQVDGVRRLRVVQADDRIVRAHPEAVVAGEAVPARHAAAGLVECV